ncbi:MAG: hypothetical protein JXB39_06890 [Deltaproteobacteria bacterium]|nr:hypothetical protein [Deltaproteobacteria bacterium]
MYAPLAALLLAGILPASRDAVAAPLDDDSIALAQAEEDEEDEEARRREEAIRQAEEEFGPDEGSLDVFKVEDLEEEEEEEPATLERLDEGDTLQPEGETEEAIDEDYGGDMEQEKFEFEDEEESVPIGGPGQDTAEIYRDFIEDMEDLGPDEEIIQWERYLQQYPNSLFKDRIQTRIENISEDLYDARVPSTEGFTDLDAGRREIRLAAPLHMEPVDPRTRVRAAFEWGYPEWINLVADYERQLVRSWSAHGGVRHRYTGWSIELGTRYALVKSARTNTIVTGILDVRGNTNPFYPTLRPQIGAGQRFTVKGHPLDVQLVGGPDLEFRSPISTRWMLGANVTYAPSDRVAFFVETNIEAKDILWDEAESFFRFPLATFGITFALDPNAKKFATVAANAPFASYYWGYHFGGVMGDFKLYQ